MIIWLDAQLSPAIASWISSEFCVSAIAMRDLGLRDAKDQEIFSAARQANAVVMTKVLISCIWWKNPELLRKLSFLPAAIPQTIS
jgi:hypothetical protein